MRFDGKIYRQSVEHEIVGHREEIGLIGTVIPGREQPIVVSQFGRIGQMGIQTHQPNLPHPDPHVANRTNCQLTIGGIVVE